MRSTPRHSTIPISTTPSYPTSSQSGNAPPTPTPTQSATPTPRQSTTDITSPFLNPFDNTPPDHTTPEQLHAPSHVRNRTRPGVAQASTACHDETATGSEDDEVECADQLYVVLQMLPQDGLENFLSQIRRFTRRLCAAVFCVLAAHAAQRKSIVELCGCNLRNCLRTAFEQVRV